VDGNPGWNELADIGGVGQTTTPLGGTANVVANCGTVPQSLYVAARLVFDSGFEARAVGGNSIEIMCGGPPASFVSQLEILAARLTFPKPGSDHFWFFAEYELDPISDGIDPELDQVAVSFGTYTETLPAGVFDCFGSDCRYQSEGPGITEAVITDRSLLFRATGLVLSGTGNPVDVAVRVGNDSGQARVRLAGSLGLSKEVWPGVLQQQNVPLERQRPAR